MMALRAGGRLGAYEIVSLLGRGAMGEVYHARDTRLGRDVAIKVLPVAFANDVDRLARHAREARLISQVNHPNICTLFDFVEGDHAPFLILELVEGETLQQRLLRGPIQLREALRCASGIAGALEAAHRKGIIHRDLKPSNIKITPSGVVKVLDFGVAKLARDAGLELGALDVTLTLGGTKEGVLVGTVAYVSPEQAMGDRVDGRSDIWAFGCLLYEMLTAARAFPGVAVADTLANVMRGEPDWSALPPDTPPELRTLLRRCLEKDRTRRLSDIGDARLEIEDLLAGRSAAAPTPNGFADKGIVPSASRRGRWIVALAFLAGVIFATVMARLAFDREAEAIPAVETRADMPAALPKIDSPPPKVESPPPKVETAPPPSEPAPLLINLAGGMRWAPAVDDGVPNTLLAISPGGRLVVYSVRAGDVTALRLRSLTSDDDWQLPGTEGGVSPFWSPDSASIGFFADRKLKRLDLNGLGTRSRDISRVRGSAALCDVRSQRGGTWGPDDTIVFAPFPGELKRISANGGTATSLTSLARGESHHVRPHFLAGTRRLLYRASSANSRKIPYYVMSLDASERTLVATLDTANVAFSQDHLLFMQDRTLMAQRFDLNRVAPAGPPIPIATGVLLSTGSRPVFGVFSASQTGRLVYLSQASDNNNPMTVLSNWAPTPAAR